MSPDEPMITLDERPNRARLKAVRIASTINLLLGVWLFVSPWVYGDYVYRTAWNSWVVGVILVAFTWMRISYPASMPGLSWFNAILGVYIFISPWIWQYTANTGRFINSLCVGFVVCVLSIYSAKSAAKTLRSTANQI